MIPETITLNVHVIRQLTGAFEHVVIFDASLKITDSPGQVNVHDVRLAEHSYTDYACVYHAVASIVAGVQSVLEPRGWGANVQISGLVIHPVDFHPRFFEQYTRQALEAQLERQG